MELDLAKQIAKLENLTGVEHIINNRAMRVYIYGAKFVHFLYRDMKIKIDNKTNRRLKELKDEKRRKYQKSRKNRNFRAKTNSTFLDTQTMQSNDDTTS